MKTRNKQRKSASNQSAIVQGFFKPNPLSNITPKIGGIRNNNKLEQILKKINDSK